MINELKIDVIAHLLDAPYKGGRADIINFFVFTDSYKGKIENKEPDKTQTLAFYELDKLPPTLMKHILTVLDAYKKHENYVVIDYNGIDDF